MKRSMLFIPGNTPSLLQNSVFLGADMLIYDLEDAVSPDEKDAARILVRNTLKSLDFTGIRTIVRINSVDSRYFEEDIKEILPCEPDMIMLPKTETAENVQHLAEAIGDRPIGIMALIETALGVENAFRIAGADARVQAIFLGAEDLTADLRCKRTKQGDEIMYARSRLVMAARAAEVDVYDTPFTDVRDDEGIIADAEKAKALGFTGKASISPRHVETINRVFSPSTREIDHAYAVMDAIARAKAQGRGAVALNGKMIDAPVVARAQQVIAAATEMGLGRGEQA